MDAIKYTRDSIIFRYGRCIRITIFQRSPYTVYVLNVRSKQFTYDYVPCDAGNVYMHGAYMHIKYTSFIVTRAAEEGRQNRPVDNL